jgi:hypothetical protein
MATETMSEQEIIIAPVKTSCADHAAEQAEAYLETAKSIKIISQPHYEKAAITLKTIKAFSKQLEEERTKITKPMDAAKAAVMNLFRKPATILEDAEKAIKSAMIAYDNEQEKIRAEKERMAREAAAKEEARQRKIKEDQERAWREKQEAARKEAEALAQKAAKEKNEAKRAEMEAQAAKARQEEAKAQEKADERAQQAQEVFVPVEAVEKTTEQPKGTSFRTVWEFEIVDVNAIPREWMIPDTKTIGGAIRSTQGKINIPGVKAIPRKTIAA